MLIWTLLLPYPPSVNRLYRIAGGRIYKSAVFKRWAEESRQMLDLQLATRQQGLRKIDKTCTLHIQLGRPDKRRRDVDNPLKGLLDLLQDLDLLEDDCLIQSLTIEWSPNVVGVQVNAYNFLGDEA